MNLSASRISVLTQKRPVDKTPGKITKENNSDLIKQGFDTLRRGFGNVAKGLEEVTQGVVEKIDDLKGKE